MALFFDGDWYDARLAERGLGRAVLAAVSGISEPDLALVYKDQREVSPAEIAAFAEILGVTAAEAALRAGISTRAPGSDPLSRIAALEARVAELEATLGRLTKG